MDLKAFALNSTRKKLLSSKNIHEELGKLPQDTIYDLLRLPEMLEPILKTFEKCKLHYEGEDGIINFALFTEGLSPFYGYSNESSLIRERLRTCPFIEINLTFSVLDRDGNLRFEYQRKEDRTVDLNSIKQFFDLRDYGELMNEYDNLFFIYIRNGIGSLQWK